MPDRAKIEALIERVEKLTGPDREVDRDIYQALWGSPPAGTIWTSDLEYYEPLTASIDAVLALAGRVLPGWSLRLHVHPNAAYADFYPFGDVMSPYFEGLCEDRCAPAEAALLALLRALAAKGDGE